MHAINKKWRIILTIVSASILVTAFLVFVVVRLISKSMYQFPEELLDGISGLNTTDYTLDIGQDVKLENRYSPLYICESDKIPEQIESFAKELGLKRESSTYVIFWKDGSGEEVVKFEINSNTLFIDLSKYPNTVKFDSINSFVNNKLGFDFEYSEPLVVDIDGTKMYMTNRVVDSKDLSTVSKYTDSYIVNNGYLVSAQMLVAKIEKVKEVVPVVTNNTQLKQYLKSPSYPKLVIPDLSEVVDDSTSSYEDLAFKRYTGDCIIEKIEQILFYSQCSSNYIYDVYGVEGICEIENTSTTFTGFINAIEPDYVKSL